MSEALTPKQEQILSMLRLHVQEKGYPPTIRGIGESVGLKSTSSVIHHLHELEAKGFIRRGPGPRALMVVGPPADTAVLSDTERLTIRNRILACLNELGINQAPALATALSHDLAPTFQQLLLHRTESAGGQHR